jgi:hypothetical protein
MKRTRAQLDQFSDAQEDHRTSCTHDARDCILLVASKDEPGGIADDWYLEQALLQSQRIFDWKWVLWDDMPSDWEDSNLRCLIIVRSLWEGRDSKGSTTALKAFYTAASRSCPALAADYALLDFIAHKRYLLDLNDLGVSIVPTALITSHRIEYAGIANANRSRSADISVGATRIAPGDIKRFMEQNGWNDAVLKPAVGTRCEGVQRLFLSSWDLQAASAVSRALAQGDCLLQPFLPSISCENGPQCDSEVNSLANRSNWGEICIIFINGVISHAIHKNPSLWGWHQSSCSCSSVDGHILRNAVCSCGGIASVMHFADHMVLPSILGGSEVAHLDGIIPAKLSDVLKQAPVESLLLPLPNCVSDVAYSALRALPGFNIPSSVTPRNKDVKLPLLCRIDLLPRLQKTSEASIEWVVSEIEGQWCECFLRAAPPEVAPMLAGALGNHFQRTSSNYILL